MRINPDWAKFPSLFQLSQRLALDLPILLTPPIYLFLKSKCFHWYLTDENIYYYLARDLSVGNLPYRDFFYANPPLLLPLLKVSGLLLNGGIFGLRLVPLLATFLAGLGLYLLMRTFIGRIAVIPLWVYWGSYDALRASTHATGINLTLMFVVWAFFLASRGRWVAVAVSVSLGLWTKTYAIVALPGVLAALWLFNRRAGKGTVLRALVVVVSSLVLLALLGSAIGGNAFWEMNLFYHLNKPLGSSGTYDTFHRVFGRNSGTGYVLLLACIVALVGILSRALRRIRAKGHLSRWEGNRLFPRHPLALMATGFIHILTVFLFLIFQNRLFDFYFLLFLPGLGLLLGGLLGAARGRGVAKSGGRDSWVLCILPGALTLLILAQPLLPSEKRLFLKGPVSYWEHEARTIDRLSQLKDIVSHPEGATLCGDSSTAPLLATLAGIHLAGGEADTNSMRFRAGYPKPEDFIQKLEEHKVGWLLMRVARSESGRIRPVGDVRDFGVCWLRRAGVRACRIASPERKRRSPPVSETVGRSLRQA